MSEVMSEALLSTLLRQALLLSLSIALLWALRPVLLKRLGAGTAYAAWLLVPAMLLTPALPRPAQEPLRVVRQATTGTAVRTTLPALPVPPRSHAPAWLALWVAGAAVVVGVQARRQWRITRMGERLPAGSSPALVGLLRPRVALPADFEQRFDPSERELILAHEQVHRERLDNLWNLLAWGLTALHWWNPLAWWAQRRLQADQELACDAAVLASRPGATATYTRALLAAHGLTAHGAPLASRWGTTHPLVERIAMLNRPRSLTRRGALLVAISASSLSALAYAAQESPAPASGAFLQLQVMLEQQKGDTKETRNFRLVGGDGTRMMVMMTGAGGDSFQISLKPHKMADNQIRIESQVSRGAPPVELGRPVVQTALGEKARMEFSNEAGEKFALEITPTAMPADYQPPARTSFKPPQ